MIFQYLVQYIISYNMISDKPSVTKCLISSLEVLKFMSHPKLLWWNIKDIMQMILLGCICFCGFTLAVVIFSLLWQVWTSILGSNLHYQCAGPRTWTQVTHVTDETLTTTLIAPASLNCKLKNIGLKFHLKNLVYFGYFNKIIKLYVFSHLKENCL